MSYIKTRLSKETLRQYATLRAQVMGPEGPTVEERCEKLQKNLETREGFAQRIHVLINPADSCALMSLMAFPFQGPPWQAIVDWSTSDEHRQQILEQAPELIRNWLKDLRELTDPPNSLSLRLNLDRAFDGLEEILKASGWIRGNERYEFKTPVTELPSNWEGPLAWKDLNQAGLDLTARIMEEAGQGPEWDNNDTGESLIDAYLSDKELTNDPSCIEVGFLPDGKPAAFVVAQTAPSDGWCTIMFMGIIPEVRGRGLGQWVHRRGFELMRRQGGKQYHGGTSAGNKSMLRLFEKHGCRPYAHLAEWVFPMNNDE